MTPVSPVLPGNGGEMPTERGSLMCQEIIFGATQPQYVPLPALRSADGVVTSRWRLTWRERVLVLFSGNLWIQQMTCGTKLQPVKLRADEPPVEEVL